ncbi:YedE family putative selenium transporter [Halarsenatibacter silvermanii]|uniref:Uncharacterized protein n=1 Tax=Halarsenatibacter silvermanii TaxID=321763 RepID=A0A1G9TFG1_9FIRM|nr:YedE family putative selenium transporter [Halarsenatibacter silvermanii]SDM46466.1 hypothetical protein SAMN04488692_1392 [Halarsenatibacter silvermanii]
MDNRKFIILSGGIIGILASLLVYLGNPSNMGICMACFYRDIAGGLGLHRADIVQNLRPEIVGFVLGGFVLAKSRGELKPRTGSNPLLRFLLGAFMAIGALVFLGCPWRMILRLSGGDLTALGGLFGYIAGIYIGVVFLRKGFSLGRAHYDLEPASGYVIPLIFLGVMVLRLAGPEFIFLSEAGPGSEFAPVSAALLAGLVVGGLAQRSRICTAGAIRDMFLIGDNHLLNGIIMIFLLALAGNLVLGQFTLGFADQPVAHNEFTWNFLGMVIVGITAVMLGGCPLRQTILASEGDMDAGLVIFGLIVGAAFSHNFGLAASPEGVAFNGRLAAVLILLAILIIGVVNIRWNRK